MQMYMMKISMKTPKDDLIEKQKDCSDYCISNSYVKRYLHKLIYKRKTAEKNVGLKFQMSQNRLQKPQKREEKSYSNLSIFC